jgi:hypothetical protein
MISVRESPLEERKESEHRAQGRGGEAPQKSGEGSRLIRDRDQFEGSRCLMCDKRGNNSQDNSSEAPYLLEIKRQQQTT